MKKKQRSALLETILLLTLFGAIITIGVLFYHFAEGLRWVDAIYFTTATLTTVGYGDFVPQTDAGKLFTSVYAFLGIGLFFGMAGVIFHNMLAYSKNRVDEKHRKRDPARTK